MAAGNVSQTPRRKVVVLTLTHQCNLRCTYCYEATKSSQWMPEATAKHIIAHELDLTDAFDEVEFDFHGGEPFLAFETIRAVCEWTWRQHWAKPFLFFATTNGTLVHQSVQKWLAEHRSQFWCSLSLDGSPQMHELNRPGSFGSLDIEFFKQTWPQQPMKMTVSPATLPLLATGVKYMHERGLEFTCNLACGLKWEDAHIPVLVEQVAEIVDYYLNNPSVTPCNLLQVPLDKLCWKPHADGDEIPRWCGIGSTIKAYDIDGTCYGCQSLIPFDGSRVATDKDGLGGINPIGDLPEDCKACACRPICRTCYAANYAIRGNPTLRCSMECVSTRVLTEASAYLYAQWLGDEILPPHMREWRDARIIGTCNAIEQLSLMSSTAIGKLASHVGH